jgi:HK97 family phage portal protein
MGSYVTESGLVVTDRRHSRSDGDDPRSWTPNDNVQPPPPVSVGPNTSAGFGNYHVMYPGSFQGQPVMPPPVMPWSGWPVDWATPNWGETINGLAEIIDKVSVVFGAIDLNSFILSTMPPYRLVGQTVVEPLPWMINPQPEVYTGWIEAMRQVVASFWTGEAFLWATSRYADDTVRTWVVLNPGWVEVELEGHVRTYYLGGNGNGDGIDITDDVLHIRYLSWPGLARGIGPLAALATNLFGVQAMEAYQANLAVRGGIPWGALVAPGNLTNDQATDMRERFVAARMSAMGAPAVLSGGVQLQPFAINPKDMALLELRQFDEGRIATLLGVPPTLLGLPTGDRSLTYRNAESIYDFHWRAYLRPRAAEIMEAISQWALPRTQSVELNRDEYVRPDLNGRANAYATLFNLSDELGRRAITIPEIRAAERFARIEEEEEDPLRRLAELGAPKRVLWEAAGIPAEEIDRWESLAEGEQMATSRATASVLGALDPYTNLGGSGNGARPGR